MTEIAGKKLVTLWNTKTKVTLILAQQFKMPFLNPTLSGFFVLGKERCFISA